MLSLRDLRFVLCSRDLGGQRAQRIIGFFSYPQNNEVAKSGHVADWLAEHGNKQTKHFSTFIK